MILTLFLVIGLLLWLLHVKLKLFLQSNGIINLIYKIIMVIQLQCIQHNIVNKYQKNNGNINQNYKVKQVGQQQCIQLDIVNKYLQNNGNMIQNFKMIMVMEILWLLNWHLMVLFLQSSGNTILVFKDGINGLQHYGQHIIKQFLHPSGITILILKTMKIRLFKII